MLKFDKFRVRRKKGASLRHLVRMIAAALGTGAMYILASRAVQEFPVEGYLSGDECVQGMSGALFALKVGMH
jgi:hypothetical protein